MKKLFVMAFAFIVTVYILINYVFVPNLSRYPNLSACFKTTVHKINLCSANPNYTNLDHISKYFIHSTLISEDDSFYLHKGIDWNEFKKSFQQNLKLMKFARGGSTITQQLVKNAYLTQSKSIFRKFKEILLAQQVEETYPKAIILEKYLNVIELGNGIYGVKPAARKYFGKSPSELNLLEAVYLTTLLPNPKVYSQSIAKGKLPSWQSQRIETLLYRLLKRQRISEDLYNVAKSNINNFPWKGVDLIETKDIENDNLDFLHNSKDEYFNESLNDKVKKEGLIPSTPTDTTPSTDGIYEEPQEGDEPESEEVPSEGDEEEEEANDAPAATSEPSSPNDETPSSDQNTEYMEEGDPNEEL